MHRVGPTRLRRASTIAAMFAVAVGSGMGPGLPRSTRSDLAAWRASPVAVDGCGHLQPEPAGRCGLWRAWRSPPGFGDQALCVWHGLAGLSESEDAEVVVLGAVCAMHVQHQARAHRGSHTDRVMPSTHRFDRSWCPAGSLVDICRTRRLEGLFLLAVHRAGLRPWMIFLRTIAINRLLPAPDP